MPYSIEGTKEIPPRPQSLDELSRRFMIALLPTYGEISISSLPLSQIYKHIFDFEDGMRLVVSFHKYDDKDDETLQVIALWANPRIVQEIQKNSTSHEAFLVSMGATISSTLSIIAGFPIRLACARVGRDMTLYFYGETRKGVGELKSEFE